MCLAVPSRIIEVDASGAGQVDYQGTSIRVDFTLIPDAKSGDWVIVHAGFAISRLDEKEARATLKLLREVARTG